MINKGQWSLSMFWLLFWKPNNFQNYQVWRIHHFLSKRQKCLLAHIIPVMMMAHYTTLTGPGSKLTSNMWPAMQLEHSSQRISAWYTLVQGHKLLCQALISRQSSGRSVIMARDNSLRP